MSEFTTESGADVVIRIAPFEDSMELKAAVTKELADSGFDFNGIEITKETDVMDLLPMVIKAVLSLDSSARVNAALFKCLARCTYNGQKISRDTFEPVEAREDYYKIVFECMKVNLSPFFKRLHSVFQASGVNLDQYLKYI